MNVKKSFMFGTNSSFSGEYTEPSICPRCNHAIKPHELGISSYLNEEGSSFISAHYQCRHCYQTFVSLYSCIRNVAQKKYSAKLLYCGPAKPTPHKFEETLEKLSPKFVEIYNQAHTAESYGLNEICGMGYRKSLEFLIKDYLIHKDPDAKDTIEKMELGNCIANKISDEDIKAVASRCAWLGNDESHYIRRFEEYDLETLKALLDATIFWVSMKLKTELASSIERRR